MLEVFGIDWATTKSRRYAVRLAVDVQAGALKLVEAQDKVDDAAVHAICADDALDSVGIDVAFGWPTEFCGFVADWRPGDGADIDAVEPNAFMFRRTDRVVSEAGLGRPLSVSTNLLGRSAQSWTHQFLADGGPEREQIDVLGDERGGSNGPPRLVEVYPKATLNALVQHASDEASSGLQNYNRRDATSRVELLHGLKRAVGLEGLEADTFGSNEHRVDALLAAIATAIYATACRDGQENFRGWSVRRPTKEERADARREGWIFVPTRA